MATHTPNYDLKKSAPDDFYNIEDQNENMDKIDSALKGIEDELQIAEEEIQEQITTINNKIDEHLANDVRHITAQERTAWDAKETPDGARKKVEQTDFRIYKSGKDSEGVFTIVEYKRDDGSLAAKSVLSGGTSPNYSTRTISYYGFDGETIEKTTIRTLTYDEDGALVSEV